MGGGKAKRERHDCACGSPITNSIRVSRGSRTLVAFPAPTQSTADLGVHFLTN
ncbi:hypothetical protein FIBSPDRAFT_851307 [Athelia psychrophila]|uniref:Uncharacterized protein n=1 Tax=Athelia psychrophila TaxID=1759441 RepID=A0A166SPI9_9AGAM|nr:hypothetical protein FIBSPDRAFT_879748 [Fibularhizoctonia sp. CBS 109695]KZP29689.1 hypothetical protein FIBSPDRAFT_851307 [Fibularhizoctonia sp. CBS 109695]